MQKTIDNPPDYGFDRIKNDPSIQLRIIQHVFPEAVPGKKFKTHLENTPSSCLKLDNGKYWLKNFGNNEKAKDWLNVVQEHLNCNASDALSFVLTNILNDTKSKSFRNQDEYSSFDKKVFAIQNNSKQLASQYLVSRGILVNELPEGAYYQSNNEDKTVNRIVFIDSEKQLINSRKLTIEKGQYYNDGKLNNALYVEMYRPSDEWVFLVEGCINALSLQSHSSIAFFSAGNNFNDYPKLEKYIKEKRVILAFDNDKAGEQMASQILSLIVDHSFLDISVFQLKLSSDQDINDLLRAGALEDFLSNGENYQQLYPQLIDDSIDEANDVKKHGYFKRQNCYWIESNIKGVRHERCISNFVMDVVYFFPDGTDNAKRIFYLQNKFGKTELAIITAKSLSLEDFKAVIRSKGNFSFRGTKDELDRILEEVLQRDKEAKELTTLGQHLGKGYYTFANGIIQNGKFHKVDKYGVVELHSTYYYLPAFSFINRHSQEFLQDQKFQFRMGKGSFSQWSQMVAQAYDEKGIIGIVFVIASIYRDIIIDELGFFPYLFLFGDWGVGKTSYTEFLLSLFYNNYKGISLEANSTPKSIARTAHKIRNGLLYLKEYDNKIEKNIIGLLKTGYEGIAYSRAQSSNDFKTMDTFINSSIIIDGNSLPSASSALLSRMVVLDFRNNNFTSEQVSAFKQLEQYKADGLGKTFIEIIIHRKHFKAVFSSCFNEQLSILKERNMKLEHLSERSIKHMALFLAVFQSLSDHLIFPFTYQNLFDWIKRTVTDQDIEIKSINRVNRFWRALDFLKSEKKLHKDIHYKYASKSDGTEYLGLNIQLLHKIYMQTPATWDGEPTSYNDLIRLLINDPAYIPSWMNGRSNTVTIKGLGSAYAFDISKIQLNLDLWER
ncbi:Toprim domain-containing protein [Breznakibacter xylanolyticus]|uniref:Toprim domain-containing protein n=1 Tax=Breznakibacter xylanolyticus TaxID=990 RepID=A0A2W7QDQ5_9BACT|nr:toprim domain-containing protein [Breznakibacter xylanolyticus]PZX19999.1 Toprim domain-containing protein [Breznakibacter xylanolyticus]